LRYHCARTTETGAQPAFRPLALSQGAISPGADVWFVGDADIDMECAQNSGITPILLRQETLKEGEFPDFHPHRHIGSCLELCKLVESM